ncbi:hypothetical protein WCU73_07665 [Pectobacterium brasiliense]|uniref:hypothetical protein n=1 Tax=Pectobacterium TaxID=122277 RepID=UPI00293BF3BC|nr:hypothetical protein [Pectobacterium sp. HCp5_1]
MKFCHAARSARHLPFHGCHLSLAHGKKVMLSTPDVTLLQSIEERRGITARWEGVKRWQTPHSATASA